MSGYFSVVFRASDDAVAAPLRPLFATPGFRPVAVGAAAGSGADRSWFLAGYALESFVTPAILRGLGVPASVERFASDSEDAAYLERLLAAPERAPLSLSPFEHRAGEATYLDPIELAPGALDRLAAWSSGRAAVRATLYGAVALAAPRSTRSGDVFRLLLPEDGNVVATPFLSIRAERRETGVELSLASESDAWLEGDDAAGATALAAVASALRGDAAPGLLRVEGARFERNAEALREALADSVERVEVGW